MRKVLSLLAYLAIGLAIFGMTRTAFACRVYLDFSASVPLNAVQLGNDARVKLASTVILARDWPDETIASISTPAFATENKPHELAIERAEAIKSYLIQLGIPERNISYDANVISHPIASTADARDRLRDVYIEFTPQCDGHCARLCDGSYSAPKK